MIGVWGNHAQTYLLVVFAAITLVFALPLSVAPSAWARVLLWKIPDDTDLVVYFGRGAGFFLLASVMRRSRPWMTGTTTSRSS
jgi:hypothetical protein